MLVVLGKEIAYSERSLVHLFDKRGNAIPLIPEGKVHAVSKYKEQNDERRCGQQYSAKWGNPRTRRIGVRMHGPIKGNIQALCKLHRLLLTSSLLVVSFGVEKWNGYGMIDQNSSASALWIPLASFD